MNLTLAHVLIMSATLLIVIGGGIYAARAVKTAEGYSLGGRSSGADKYLVNPNDKVKNTLL